MKLRRKIVAGFIALAAVCAVILFFSPSKEPIALEQTRRALLQQGFKINLSEFNFSTSDEFRARAAALANAVSSTVPSSHDGFARSSMLQQVLPELMQTVGLNSAIPIWKRDEWSAAPDAETYLRLANRSGSNLWSALSESFNDDQELLDAACGVTLSGPIRFNLNASHGSFMLLPHLATLKNLAQTLGCRAVLELHNGNKDAASTNLLAATRLVTAYEPEAVEVSHLVRFACAAISFNITWQALQTDNWPAERLAVLQREWEPVDFFRELPETAAFTRASMADACQREREQPLVSGPSLNAIIRSPRSAWSEIKWRWQQLRYRHHGSYEDEKNLLLYYRDRELELRRAVQCATWSEMRQFPGVTNVVPFKSRYSSRIQAMLNTRQMGLSFQKQGQGLLGRAAETETRRRLIITAIALERFRGRHGSYPKTLQELAPEFLKATPTDFMDGQPLRYGLTEDDHFVLYSIGLDCVDDQGKMQQRRRRGFLDDGAPPVGIPQQTDLVWPRPASAVEISSHEQFEQKAKAEESAQARSRADEEERQREVSRRTTVEKLLAMRQVPRAKEPTFGGRPLSKVFRNTNAPASARLTLDELLTLKQIKAGEDSDIVTFEVPVNYDVVTNIGGLRLLVDAEPGDPASSDEGQMQECTRATNGNCLLVWNTIYDAPGQHALQAQLHYTDRKKGWEETYVEGPVRPYFSSNLFQLDSFNAFSERSAYLRAKLAEPNGTYAIELKSPSGEHIRTFRGSTTNGTIEVDWNLIDERGQRYTNDSFETSFSTTLLDSGRSITNK